MHPSGSDFITGIT